jgi:hypothetical protein
MMSQALRNEQTSKQTVRLAQPSCKDSFQGKTSKDWEDWGLVGLGLG